MIRRYAWLLFLPALPWVQARVDGPLGGFRPEREILYLWSGEQVKRIFPGFEDLAADLYWLRVVQYFGGERLFATNKRFDLLAPLIKITTTLDPRLEMAYRYGAIFLCEPPPAGAGRPKEGIQVLERGSRALPKSWRLRQDLGFYSFLFLHDPERAFQILMQASEIPGAPFWLKTLAADVLAKGGERAASRRVWSRLYEQTEGVVKLNAFNHLQVLDAVDGADALTALVNDFKLKTGRRPETLGELVSAGLTTLPLVDPSGVPFKYDPASGRVSVSQESSLWRP